TATPAPTATAELPLDARLGNGMTVGQYLEQEAQRRLQFDREQEIASTRVTPTPTPEANPEQASLEARGAFAPGMARISPSLGLSSFWKVMRYRDLIQQSAEQAGADAAIMAALMEVEGSGEDSVSPAGAVGLMQLMPDKFRPGDDPFDPPTNLRRAAQHIKQLQDRWRLPELVAAAYFGAIDDQGRVTAATDGNISG